MTAAKDRQDSLTKPQGSLGRLEDLSIQVAGVQHNAAPRIADKAIITMAADHGVVREGVTLYPQAVTAQMVANFLSGGAGVNVLAKQSGCRVVVVDMGVAVDLPAHPSLRNRKIGLGTENMLLQPAMSPEQAVKSLETGIEIANFEAEQGLDIVGIGEMGIGNTTSASVITAAVTGAEPGRVTGRGTGLDDERLQHKIGIVSRILQRHCPDPRNALEILRTVGGYEIGGMAGAMIAAAARRIPVVLDGFICGAAALIASLLAPRIRDYFVAAHRSVEAGHQVILDHLGLTPLLDLQMRLGEGSGAALGIFMTESACRVLNEMATFAEAGVSETKD